MAEFVELEAMDVDRSSRQIEDEGEDGPSVSDNEFIDDSEQPQSDYSCFTNVTRTYEDVMHVLRILKILMHVTILIVMTMKMICIIFQILKQKLVCFASL